MGLSRREKLVLRSDGCLLCARERSEVPLRLIRSMLEQQGVLFLVGVDVCVYVDQLLPID